jgi:exopolysaccharide production protein ExoZ
MTALSLVRPPPVPPPPVPTEPHLADRGGTYLSIQALRGIAALLVTVFHAGLRFDPTEMTFRVGNAGVDIFFVISGFVMWTVTTRRPTPPLVFLGHRFIRLVPMYWFWTLVLIAGWAVIPSAFPRMHPTLSHVVLSMAFIPHLSPDTGVILPVMGQGWTLNFEVLFYILFAVTLLLPLRSRLAAITVTLLGLAVVGHFVATPAWPVTTLLNPLLVEFLGGIVLARLVLGGWRPHASWCWGALAIGVALLFLPAPAADDDLARLFQFGVPAFLIVGGAVGAEALGKLRIGRLPRLLGDASYSIYLTHPFAISLLNKVWPGWLPPWLFITVATVFAAVAGIVAFTVLENPLLALMRRRRPKSTAVVAPP